MTKKKTNVHQLLQFKLRKRYNNQNSDVIGYRTECKSISSMSVTVPISRGCWTSHRFESHGGSAVSPSSPVVHIFYVKYKFSSRSVLNNDPIKWFCTRIQVAWRLLQNRRYHLRPRDSRTVITRLAEAVCQPKTIDLEAAVSFPAEKWTFKP